MRRYFKLRLRMQEQFQKKRNEYNKLTVFILTCNINVDYLLIGQNADVRSMLHHAD